MAKRMFVNPFVVLSPGLDNPGDDVVEGGGTGGGGTNWFEPMTFDDWLESDFALDFNGDDEVNIEDYRIWCEDNDLPDLSEP